MANDAYSMVEYRIEGDSDSNRDMDRIKALRLFTRVVDLGSFSRAALELGIGQPAATKQVARMEQELGARLLHRSTHGVSPTDVGIRYYEKCKLIVHHDEEARSVAALTQSQVQERCASAPRSPSAAACWRRWCWTSCATMRC